MLPGCQEAGRSKKISRAWTPSEVETSFHVWLSETALLAHEGQTSASVISLRLITEMKEIQYSIKLGPLTSQKSRQPSSTCLAGGVISFRKWTVPRLALLCRFLEAGSPCSQAEVNSGAERLLEGHTVLTGVSFHPDSVLNLKSNSHPYELSEGHTKKNVNTIVNIFPPKCFLLSSVFFSFFFEYVRWWKVTTYHFLKAAYSANSSKWQHGSHF